MSIADELHKLGELHRSGALTDEEFAHAKARVLAGQVHGNAAGEQDETLREHLSELKRENELARLDREWQLERERYYMTGRYGARYIPSKASSIIIGVIAVGFGIFWTVFAASITGGIGGPGSLFPCFGVLFVLFGIGISAFSFLRANQYEIAEQRYQRRRAMLLAGENEESDASQRPSDDPMRPFLTDIRELREPAPCLGCGKTIPAGHDRCPHCGST